MHLAQLSVTLSLLLVSTSGLAIRQPSQDVSSSTQGSGWTTATCEQSSIANVNDLFVDRWNAAGVPGAWNSMITEWRRSGKNSKLSFTQFASNYFDGPEQWNCANIGNVDCSTTVQCQDTNRPAGFLLLNAFSGIHQLHAETSGALQTAMAEIQSKIGDFTATFAPQSDDSKTIQAIIDGLSTIFGFGISGIFATVEKDVAKAATGLGSSRKSSQSSKSGKSEAEPSDRTPDGTTGESSDASTNRDDEERDPDEIQELGPATKRSAPAPRWKRGTGFNAEGFAHDMAFQLVGLTGAWVKDNVPQVHDKLEAQNSLSSALGDLFKSWTDMEAGYLENIFSGEESSLQNLQDLIGDGKMNYMPSTLNQNAMAKEVVSVLYGQLMPTAWKAASNGAGAHPFVLKTDISCDDHSADFKQPNQSSLNDGYEGLMTDEDSAQTRVCWRDNWAFLVNANEWDFYRQVHFTPLPGADNSTLSQNWGGITLEDIVSSAITGYEGRGGGKNGYDAPAMNEILKNFGKSQYGKTVRYPGFFNIPVCESVEQAKSGIRSNHKANSPYWPCAEPPNYNSKGTTIHVNHGYININEKPVCDSFTISDPGNGDTLSATIYAGFDGSNTAEPTVSPKCKLSASWPKSYGDIYYGEDNCLYDSESQQIKYKGNAQCCSESEGLEGVSNPYVAGAECQSS